MKKTFLLLLGVAALTLCMSSCQKDELNSVSSAKEQIVLSLNDSSIDMNVSTKVTEIARLPENLYLARTSGTWKSETSVNASASKEVVSGKIATGWYQTNPATAYNYYVSNVSMTFGAAGSLIFATNTTDVIAGCTQGADNGSAPSLTLDHIFARTATFSCEPQDDSFDISGISWKIASKAGSTGGTSGTYNIASSEWSNVTALAQTDVSSYSDFYLTPGVYTITVSYTLAKGSYSESFTKSGEVTLVAGKKNNISCTVSGGSSSEIQLSVTLNPWGEEDHVLNFS